MSLYVAIYTTCSEILIRGFFELSITEISDEVCKPSNGNGRGIHNTVKRCVSSDARHAIHIKYISNKIGSET